MGDGSIDMVISHIEMGYLFVTLPSRTATHSSSADRREFISRSTRRAAQAFPATS